MVLPLTRRMDATFMAQTSQKQPAEDRGRSTDNDGMP
jgi:hypothetical protein